MSTITDQASGILNDAAAALAKQRQDAEQEYRELTQRYANPQPTDAARLVQSLEQLGITIDDARKDVAALQRVEQLQASLVSEQQIADELEKLAAFNDHVKRLEEALFETRKYQVVQSGTVQNLHNRRNDALSEIAGLKAGAPRVFGTPAVPAGQ